MNATLTEIAAELERGLPDPLRSGAGPVFLAFAPASLDVLGGTAAFAGAVRLDAPLADGAVVALRRGRDGEEWVSVGRYTGPDDDALELDAARDTAIARALADATGADATRVAAGQPQGAARAGSLFVRPTDPLDPPALVRLPPGLALVAVLLPSRAPDAARDLRVAAAIGYRLIAARCGLTVHTGERGDVQQVDDPYFEGRLANVDPVTYAAELRDALPERMAGGAFLDQFGGVADPDAAVAADHEYLVRAATTYAIAEHQRACRAVDLLHRAPDDCAEQVGAAFEESYLQARELGLVAPDSETFVTEVRRRGAARGLYGVRPAHGGALAVVLAPGDGAERALDEAIAAFEREHGRTPVVCRGAADGASAPANGLTLEA